MPVDFHLLEQLFKNQWVVAAWLFGSSRDGAVRPGSDVDMAVLADPKPNLDQLLELQALLADATGEEVDLVVLNDASSVLRFEALQGRPLYCRDLASRAVFASRTAREYEDDMGLADFGMRAWREGQGSFSRAAGEPAQKA